MALRTWNQTAIIKYLQTGSIRRGSNRSTRRLAHQQSKQQWPSSKYKNTNEGEESTQIIHNVASYSVNHGIQNELYPKRMRDVIRKTEEINNLAEKARQYHELQTKMKTKLLWDKEKKFKAEKPAKKNWSEINVTSYYNDINANEALQPSKQPSFGCLDLRSVRETPKSHKIAVVSPKTIISSLRHSRIVKRGMSSKPSNFQEIRVVTSKSKGIKFDTKETSLSHVKMADKSNDCLPEVSSNNYISCNKLLKSKDGAVVSENDNSMVNDEPTKDLLPAVNHAAPSFNAFIWEDITGMLLPKSVTSPKQELGLKQDELKKVDVAVDEEISKMNARREANIKSASVERKQIVEKKKPPPVVRTKAAKVEVPKPSKKVTRRFVIAQKQPNKKPKAKPTPKVISVDDLNKQINRLKKNDCLLDKLIKKTASTNKVAKKKVPTNTAKVETKSSSPDLSLFNKVRSTSNVPNSKGRSTPKKIEFSIDIPQSCTAIVYKKRKFSTLASNANVARLFKKDGMLVTDLPRFMSQRTNKSHFEGICDIPDAEYQDHSESCHCVEPFKPSVLPKLHRLVKRYNTNMGSAVVPKECLPPCATIARADDNLDLYRKKCLPDIKDTDCPCVERSEYTRKVKLCRLTRCIPCPNQQQTCPDPCPKTVEKCETYIPKKCLPKLPESPCVCVEPKRLSVMPKLSRLVKRCDDGPVATVPKCEKACKIERADDNIDLYKRKCLPEIEDSACNEFCDKPLKSVKLCRLVKKDILASVGEIREEKCEPKEVFNVYVAKKKLPKFVPGQCECIEPPVAATMPKLCRLVKKKAYLESITPTNECIPICSITPRADDSLDLYKKRCLPEIKDSECLCVDQNLKDVKMCRLEKKRTLSLSECKVPCTTPRADNITLYEVEKRKLPSFPCSPCLCIEPDVPKILPKIPKLTKRPVKHTDLPIVPPCEAPCANTPRADNKVNLYLKKCLPDIEESQCDCIEPPKMKNVPLCRPKKNEIAGLAHVKEICEKPCEETADDVCKYEVKKKKLKPILPRRRPYTKSSSRGFQCFKPNNSKKRFYSSQPCKVGKILSDSEDESEQEKLVLKILRLIKQHARETQEKSDELLDITGSGVSKKLTAITYDNKFKLIPSESLSSSIGLEEKAPSAVDMLNENSRPGGIYFEEYEELENKKTKNMQEILDEMLKKSKGS